MTAKDEVTGVPTGDLRNIAYRAIIKECERIEHTGKYKGNGHHLAQRLADMMADELILASTVEKNNHMNDQIRETDKKLAAMRTDREKMLDEAKLNTMSRNYSCSITELHPTLIEFDTESDRLRKEILLKVRGNNDRHTSKNASI